MNAPAPPKTDQRMEIGLVRQPTAASIIVGCRNHKIALRCHRYIFSLDNDARGTNEE
jgi:hypothetical protein